MNLIQADIDEHWEDIKHGLYSIKEETYESETAKDIYGSCKNNTATLWLDKDIQPKDGFLITQILNKNFSNERYLLLWVAWYKEQSGAEKFQPQIEKDTFIPLYYRIGDQPLVPGNEMYVKYTNINHKLKK